MLILLAFLCFPAAAQTGEWAWMGGPNTIPSGGTLPGTYGTLGVASKANIPGGRQYSVSWKDEEGNLWLFGGIGFDINGGNVNQPLNDLWKFDYATKEWTWMGGSSTYAQSGTYGTLGKAAVGNVPGARDGASSWTDSSGNFWLFGGDGVDDGVDSTAEDYLNDLWKYDPSTNEWAWMGGSSQTLQLGVYGTLGKFSDGNAPGCRSNALSWTDSNGNFWLFGGQGCTATFPRSVLNDLWEFKPSTNQWAWMGGSSTGYQGGVYGTLKTAAAGNVPGSRTDASGWADSSGNLWLFGGYGADINSYYSYLNDLWEFNPSTSEWTWMGGSSTALSSGVYGTLGTPSAKNIPAARDRASTWTDGSGNFWLFAGEDDYSYMEDLWKLDSSTNEWTWMGGYPASSNGVYGKLGTPAAGNIPGSRQAAASWIGNDGSLWLFGGYGGEGGGWDSLNDLWKYEFVVNTPIFSVAAGKYPAAQSVKITDATAGAKIYYTLDGSMPTSKSTQYTGAVSIATTTTLKAIAKADNFINSAVATAKYTILKPQTISFTPPSTPVTYGVKPITLVAAASSGLAVKFSVISGSGKISGSTLGITGVGKVVVAANQAGNSTYGAAPQVTQSITVNKAALTVTAKNLTMKKGAAVPALTYKMAGFVKSDNQANATSGQPVLMTTATSKSAAGTYPITITAGTLAAANYSFTFVNGTLTVK